jgi:hypothetical protein
METGRLEWDLGARTSHSAGSYLSVAFKITNPTAGERSYRLWVGLFDLSGPVITTFPLPDVYIVPANAERTITVSFKIDYSNCMLQASIYDIETGEMGAALQTILEQPPSPIEQVSPAITAVAGLGLVGMLCVGISRVVKGGRV